MTNSIKRGKEGELYADFWRNKFYTREQVEREMIGKYGNTTCVTMMISESFDRQVRYIWTLFRHVNMKMKLQNGTKHMIPIIWLMGNLFTQ